MSTPPPPEPTPPRQPDSQPLPPPDLPPQSGLPAFPRDDGYPPPAYEWDQQPAGVPPGGQPASTRSNGLAIASLVLGVLSIVTGLFVIGGLFGLIGLILGFLGRGKAKRGEAGNGGIALAGIITSILGMLIAVGVLALGAFLVGSDTFQNLTECLNAAGNDQAAAEQCVAEFQPGD